jgi:hypothetical protein
MRRAAMLAAAGVLAVVGIGGFVCAGIAQAATYGCDSFVAPPAGIAADAPVPTPYGGSTVDQAYAWGAWVSLFNGCRVTGERLEALASALSSTGEIGSDLRALHDDLGTTGAIREELNELHTDLAQLHTDLTSGPPVSGTVDLGSSTLASQDAAAAQLDGDLWVICGVLVGCWAMGIVLRRVFP